MNTKHLRFYVIGSALAFGVIPLSCGGSGDGGSSDGSAGAAGSATGGSGGAGTGGSGGAGTGGSSGSGTGGGATGGSAGMGTGGVGTGGGAGAGTGGSAGAGGAPSCTDNSDCDDGEECNGTETCTGGSCAPGTALSDGTSCTPLPMGMGGAGGQGGASGAAGAAGAAGSAGAANFVCGSSICQAGCEIDADCDDADVCTGVETCNPTTKVCQVGTPMTCDDTDDCTDNMCDPLTGCFFTLIDGDGDGHASDSIGSCGDDCDDTDPDVFTGAAELCDLKDNDCNGNVDETAPNWYEDCDDDDFAPQSAQTVQQCNEPSSGPGSCTSGGWTSQGPGAGTTDCWDQDADAHPYTAAENNNAFSDTAITGAPANVDFDYNCDGNEETRFNTTGISSGAICFNLGGGTGCFGGAGWTGPNVPACGATAQYTSCRRGFPTGCSRFTRNVTQECR